MLCGRKQENGEGEEGEGEGEKSQLMIGSQRMARMLSKRKNGRSGGRQ